MKSFHTEFTEHLHSHHHFDFLKNILNEEDFYLMDEETDHSKGIFLGHVADE